MEDANVRAWLESLEVLTRNRSCKVCMEVEVEVDYGIPDEVKAVEDDVNHDDVVSKI